MNRVKPIARLVCEGEMKMTVAKLSETQLKLLFAAAVGPMDDACLKTVEGVNLRTARSLERRGLIRWFPYGAGGVGCWKITQEGRRVVAQKGD